MYRHMTLTLALALVVALALVPAGAAAQQTGTANTTATAAPTGEAGDRLAVYGDPAVWIADWEYRNETFHVTLLVEQYRPSVTLTASGEATEGGSTRGHIVKQELTRGTHTLSIPAPDARVAVSTSVSTSNGFFTQLKADTGGAGLVPGPFDGTDTRNAAIGGALGVSLFVFKMAYDARHGRGDGGERIA